ncbi:hypothetical protein LZ318_06825 [Saccharopolyspora indica]|uniref:hypothetical protein n=1 Tax=Saccharopolyspora indica TaxID=1229659 RepID=UPI0022EB5AAC|nr:hypothetical protein [Saccharopolyspora indica]MDA3647861.1 hypothetical protein [Saccharopolyspora indica]
MTTFLSSIGSKLAERWASALLLPGALYLAAVWCAMQLGHRHALDLNLLRPPFTGSGNHPGAQASIVVGLVLVLLGASAAGLSAQAIGRIVQAVWFGRWRGPAALLARPLIALRVAVAVRAASRAGVTPVAAYLPRRPTAIGEQFRLLEARISAQYHGLRLALVWPRLWVLLPDGARAPIQSTNNNFHSAAVLTGWGLLYLVLGAWWFPAAVAGTCAVIAGWLRGRNHAVTLATLIEATVDTHLAVLLDALNHGLPATGMTGDLAEKINDQLHKGR